MVIDKLSCWGIEGIYIEVLYDNGGCSSDIVVCSKIANLLLYGACDLMYYVMACFISLCRGGMRWLLLFFYHILLITEAFDHALHLTIRIRPVYDPSSIPIVVASEMVLDVDHYAPLLFEAYHQCFSVERAWMLSNSREQFDRVICMTKHVLYLDLDVLLGRRIDIIAWEYVAQVCHVYIGIKSAAKVV